MTNGALQGDCLERILSAPAPVVLLRGPAACGKTAVTMALYRHYAQADGRCLLLAPNAATATAMRSALLMGSICGVVVQPTVMTFAGLVGRILADGRTDHALLSPFRRYLLLRKIVDNLNAAGELSSLSAVADTPGLTATLDKAIAELKRAAVTPEALARAVGGARGKSADLLAIYKHYQQHLHETKTYDLEGLTWLARDRLATWPGPGLPAGLSPIRAAVADGFTDFTPTEMDILVQLSRLLPRLVITLPLADDGRKRMWHWTARTAEHIRRTFSGRLMEIILDRNPPAGSRETDSTAPPLAALWDRVFDFDASPCKLPKGVSVIAASGSDAEVAAVARRIKRLLIHGEPAGSIVVLARTMDAYIATIERIFTAYYIPLRPMSSPLRDMPIIRFILDVSALPPQFAYRDVLRVIKSSYFRPQALGPFDSTTVAAAETVIRCGNVIVGQDAYTKAARRLAAKLQRGQAGLDDEEELPQRFSSQQVLQAADLLKALFAVSQSASQAAGGGLEAIVERLDLAAAARRSSPRRVACGDESPMATCDHDDPQLVARDLRALAALESAMRELPSPAPPFAMIQQALAAVVCPPAVTESAVDVMDVLDARALRYKHVFCLGLTEGQFPRRFVENSLISERDRLRWGDRGVALATRGDLVTREMLLLYLTASRADATLNLSFLESDASGRPAAPSSFLISLLDPAGKLEAAQKAGIVERIELGFFLPPPDEIASDDEAATTAVAGLFDHSYDPDGRALAWAAAHAPQRLAATATGLLARHRRWRRGPCDAYDGRITDADLLEHLAERFGHSAVFSASQLNAYGECPWQFFASYVLALEPLEMPTDRLTPLERGLFCHRVLFGVFRRLAGELGSGFSLAAVDRDRLMALLDEVVTEASGRLEAQDPPYPALWRLQRQQMRDDLAIYLSAQIDEAPKLNTQCLHFELGFGLGNAIPDSMDPASSADPVPIETPTGPVHLRGKIDRIDRVRLEDLDGLLVIDYKTGRLPSRKDIDAGRSLQAALYAPAAEKLLKRPSLGGAYHQIGSNGRQTYLAAIRRRAGAFTPDEDFDRRRQAAMNSVGHFVQSIRAGRFDVPPTHDCPSFCPFRRICHYAKHRAALKTAPPQEGQA